MNAPGEAWKKLVAVIREELETMPLRRQIEVYEALAELLPTEGERAAALEIAVTLSEVNKLQLDFNQQLFGGAA